MLNTLLELLISFLQIGLFSIGGGYATIPLIQEQVVQKQQWLTMEEFTDIITISQMTPGPLAVNTSTFVGTRIAGIPGAVIATFGCVISGFILSILLYKFFRNHQESEYVFHILKGLKAASLGLIISAAAIIVLIALYGTSSIQMSSARLNKASIVFFLTALALLRKYRVNPILLLFLSGITGVILNAIL